MRSKVLWAISVAEKLFCWLGYAWRFAEFGFGVVLRGPVRLDGARSIRLGAKSIIQRRSWLYSVGIEGKPAALSFGERCAIGYNNHITCIRSVTFGNDVLTANNVYVSDNVHRYQNIDMPIRFQPVEFKGAVTIGDGAWLGENVCVLGASVGRNCVIGANSVVTKDIPDFCVAVGNPARVIKRYNQQTNLWEKVDAK